MKTFLTNFSNRCRLATDLNVEKRSGKNEDPNDGEDDAQVEQQDRHLAWLWTLARQLTWEGKWKISHNQFAAMKQFQKFSSFELRGQKYGRSTDRHSDPKF